MSRFVVLLLFVASTALASENQLTPVRIAVPVNGHIHPAVCVSHSGTIATKPLYLQL